MEKLIAKTYKVAGVTHYQDAILALASENPDYDLTRLELIEEDHTDEKIWKYEFFPSQVQLIPEPDNPHDSHAVKVLVDGEHVGYIKSGSCSHILKQLQAGRIRSIEAEIGGGPYKCLSEDEEDSYTLEKDRIEFFVHLTVRELTEVPDQPEAPEAPRPAAPAGPFCWNCGAPLNPGAAYCVKCGAARNRPAPAPVQKKRPSQLRTTLTALGSVALILFSMILIFRSCGSAPAETEAETVAQTVETATESSEIATETAETATETAETASEAAETASETAETATETSEATTETAAPVEQLYILNRSSRKFHKPGCSGAAKIKDSNRGEFTGSRDDLISQGYDPCGICHP